MDSEVIGFMAGSLVALSLAPQVIKSIRTKSTNDISLQWSLISIAGQILWLYYGTLIDSSSLVVMSGITLAMALCVLWLKLKYGLKNS